MPIDPKDSTEAYGDLADDLDRRDSALPAMIDDIPRPLPETGFPAIAKMEILRQLGRGGMGVVYLARRADGKLVAVKVMAPPENLDAEARARFVQRFFNETRACSSTTTSCTRVRSSSAAQATPLRWSTSRVNRIAKR